jgi:hypothetical protein
MEKIPYESEIHKKNIVSVFKNLREVSEDLELPVILDQIKNGKFKIKIEHLRELIRQGKADEYNQQKKSLLAFTPSGSFNKIRKLENLHQYSGCIILDIDKLTPEKLAEIKADAINIIYTYACFISPSNNGLKIIVKSDSTPATHKQVFNLVKTYYEKSLNISIDPSGKDISRLCFYSYDQDLYLKANSEIYTTIIYSLGNKTEKIIELCEKTHTDLTDSYEDWLKIGFALTSEFGESGRNYFHGISKINAKYNVSVCDDQYNKCLNNANSGINIATFFHIAKTKGIDLSGMTSSFETKYQRASLKKILPSNIPKSSNQNKEKKPNTNKFHQVLDYLIEHFDIRYNVVSGVFEYKGKESEEYKPMNENNIFIKMCLDGLTFSINNLMAFLKSDLIEHYNPLTKYFESLPHLTDDLDHIQELANYIKLKPDMRKRFDNHFKKWLVRAVKCAFEDSYFNKQALILVHDKQNSGKSTFCRFLCPPKLSNYLAENPSIDKDSRILLTTNLLINLDEISTMSKIEINSLKSIFSKDKINERLPYDRKNSIIPRRASFIGSTNQAEFLNDESGSVRWLCFVIERIDWDYKKNVNIDEVWAQAYKLYKNNFLCDLTPDEIKENEECNQQFNITTSEFELIQHYFSPATKESPGEFMTATNILMFLNEITFRNVKLNANNIGKALKMLSFERISKYPEKIKGYMVNKKIEQIPQNTLPLYH